MKHFSHSVDQFNLVVFGGDGDLAFLKIYPSLMHRYLAKQIRKNFNIVVVSRSKNDLNRFLGELENRLVKHIPNSTEKQRQAFYKHFLLVQLETPSVEVYQTLKAVLLQNKTYQNIYYFSTPSFAYGDISNALNDSGLISENSKVVVEKPLGTDLKSFQEINKRVRTVFAERQIYRIDHYLGKETVQNLMVLRFTNHLFESSWNRENIDNIQITVAESIGVNKRGNFYDKTGALIDMVQNHLLQLLCLVAMEPPAVANPDDVRLEKLKVLKSLRPFSADTINANSIKGQYIRGKVDGQQVNSYLEDIEKYNSDTESFVGLKVFVDNWRWSGVPFYLRTGKRLEKRYSEIVINFKPVSHNIFTENNDIINNKLIIKLQPQEGIELVQMTKVPGPGGYRFKPIALELDYLDSFKDRLPDAYERLIMDVIRGNQTLFMSEDELEAAWKWIESITDNWKLQNTPLTFYPSGSMGPGNAVLNKGDEWYSAHAMEKLQL